MSGELRDFLFSLWSDSRWPVQSSASELGWGTFLTDPLIHCWLKGPVQNTTFLRCDFSWVGPPPPVNFWTLKSVGSLCTQKAMSLSAAVFLPFAQTVVTQRALLFLLSSSELDTFGSYSVFIIHTISTLSVSSTSQWPLKRAYRNVWSGSLSKRTFFCYTGKTKPVFKNLQSTALFSWEASLHRIQRGPFLRLCSWQLCKYHPPTAASLGTGPWLVVFFAVPDPDFTFQAKFPWKYLPLQN